MTPLADMVAFPDSYTKLDYDPFKDDEPVAAYRGLSARPRYRTQRTGQTLAEYVALAKTGGTYANFASAATGQPAALLRHPVRPHRRLSADARSLQRHGQRSCRR